MEGGGGGREPRAPPPRHLAGRGAVPHLPRASLRGGSGTHALDSRMASPHRRRSDPPSQGPSPPGRQSPGQAYAYMDKSGLVILAVSG
eukprot:scaffold63670_cov39-Tisochrysis_lutea.AAC.1